MARYDFIPPDDWARWRCGVCGHCHPQADDALDCCGQLIVCRSCGMEHSFINRRTLCCAGEKPGPTARQLERAGQARLPLERVS